MNLAIRGIEADFGPEQADTFRRDLHKDLKAQFVIANPPFNDSDWHRVDDDVRWQYGVPPKGNANFAWVQHFIHHLAPDGYAGFVLANGSISSNQSGEGDIRKAIIEDSLTWKTLSTRIGASPYDGSSKAHSFGCDISPLPIDSICCSPPLNVLANCPRLSFSMGKSS